MTDLLKLRDMIYAESMEIIKSMSPKIDELVKKVFDVAKDENSEKGSTDAAAAMDFLMQAFPFNFELAVSAMKRR
jgi:hypothetical protein